MSFLDDLPERPSSHSIGEAAEQVFECAVTESGLFNIHNRDRKDFGTDYQLGALDGAKVTNFRIHVQLKGTTRAQNTDGSVSVTAERGNLNYLLSQRDSIYVGFHMPSKRLLVCFASDVYRGYERRGTAWRDQKEITVRLATPFDRPFQERLNARVIAAGRSERDKRLQWEVTPPDRIPSLVATTIPLVEVPASPEEATRVLRKLYEAKRDDVISTSFERFQAVLGPVPGGMDLAYMSEINLAINSASFDRQRVIDGREALMQAFPRKCFHPGSLLFCLGNACLALGEYGNAKSLFVEALGYLNQEATRLGAAQCCKNLGAAFEALGDHDNAAIAYDKALLFYPDLPEAHYAIATRLIRQGKDLAAALNHLDAISPHAGTVPMRSVQARRVEVFFQTGDQAGAFRELNSLLEAGTSAGWVWPFCAGQVALYGRTSVDAASKALRFWRDYLSAQRDALGAKREMVMCLSLLHAEGKETGTGFEAFKAMVTELIASDDSDSAFLWDRLGHWAQDDDNWEEAVSAFQKAYDLESEGEYGYCLGTALNHVGRYQEALAVLVAQAEKYQPDAMSWFQVGYAKAGANDFAGAIDAYRKSVSLDSEYDHAWFNLGGAYWNAGQKHEAIRVWKEAIERFPSHPKVDELKAQLGHFLS